jgi:hypothetical protein
MSDEREELAHESTEQYPCCDVPGGPERCGDCPLDNLPLDFRLQIERVDIVPEDGV